MNRQQKLEWYATGYCTVGKITQVDEDNKKLINSYVGKVRGTIVTGENGDWNFDNPEDARIAAIWFRQHARDELKAKAPELL